MEIEPLETVKRKVCLVSILAGFPAIPVLWIVYGPTNTFFRVVFPPLGLFCLVCAWALMRSDISIRLVERAMFVIVFGFAFAHLVYTLSTADSLFDARTAITRTSYSTLIVLYVAAHLVFERRTALLVSVALYAASFVAVLAKVFFEVPGGPRPEEVSWLIQMHAFMGVVIALLYALAYTKDQLARQKTTAETMHQLAHTDQLTGIANRRKLYSELHKETEEAKRYARPLSVILFDLDNFKHVNDTHGHDRGDRILQEVAQIVEPLLRTPDHFGRWGGEEFILLAPETDLQQATYMAERLREEISGYSFKSNPGVTASFGLAQYRAGESPESLVKRADEALYEAKASGKNRVEPTA